MSCRIVFLLATSFGLIGCRPSPGPLAPVQSQPAQPATAERPEPMPSEPEVATDPDPNERSPATGRLVTQVQPRVLPAPPFRYTLNTQAPIEQSAKPRLRKASQKKNQITDDDRWFDEHGLELPVWEVPNEHMGRRGNLPGFMPAELDGRRIVTAIRQPDAAIAMYGPDFSGATLVVVIDRDGSAVAAFDFAQWAHAPTDLPAERQFTDQRVNWAAVQDGVLFVSHGHRTYARSSGGKNAYISALSLEDGTLLWQSEPLVANAANFLLENGWIITGYGFTAEPDHLFILDAKTGKTAETLGLRKGPTYILRKDDTVHVRTYDTDYAFTLEP